MSYKKGVVDTWTPKSASNLSLFHEWEIIHEMKRVVAEETKRLSRDPETLRDEIRRALTETSSSDDEEEVDQTTLLPRRDHTLHYKRRKSTIKELKKAQRQDLLRRLSKESLDCGSSVCSFRDTDSGIERDMSRCSSRAGSEYGGEHAGARPRTYWQRYPSSQASICTQDCSDYEWDIQSGPVYPTTSATTEFRGCPSPAPSSIADSTAIADADPQFADESCNRRKLKPEWPHELPELEPISLSIEDTLSEAATSKTVDPVHEIVELPRKLLVIGDSGVGKSSYVQRFVARNYGRQYQPTVGVDFALKVLQWSDDIKVKLQLWDIAGQERFTSMTRVYYKDAHACLIMFDLTRELTFKNAARWKQDLDSKCTLADGRPIPCMLLANKCDLHQQREVDQETIEAFIKEHNFVGWTETSVKTGSMVDESMKFLVDELMSSHNPSHMPESTSICLTPEQDREKTQSQCSC